MNDAAMSAGPGRSKKATSVALINQFWEFSSSRVLLSESERLSQIRAGMPAQLYIALRAAFELQEPSVTILMASSTSTLERRLRARQPLDAVASERLDRIAAVSNLAEEVFESRDEATKWMANANESLGGSSPVMLCETEIGAKQVRRVLHALEWGGAA